MSTKATIKYRERSEDAPGFHVYEDLLDSFCDGGPSPVYLALDGVHVELHTLQDKVSVTVRVPRETAEALGLISGT